MPPKKPKPNQKGKRSSKQQRNKKRRKQKKYAHALFSYTLLPRRKRLAKKVVVKLDAENNEYMIAQGLDAIKRLDQGKVVEGAREIQTQDELRWRIAKKKSTEHKSWRENKIMKIRYRELQRRKRAAEKREEELRRKRYRLHPMDRAHMYIPGYTKRRHRITKARFMKCVDVPLFEDILNANKNLQESPLWHDKLSLQNLSVEKARQYKEHLYQFDVLVEGLKQGIFDLPECDEFPLQKVRRKKKKVDVGGQMPTKTKTQKPSRKRANSGFWKRGGNKRRLSFPPFEASDEDLDDKKPAPGVIKGAINKVARWMDGTSTVKGQAAKNSLPSIKSVPQIETLKSVTKLGTTTIDDSKDTTYSEVREKPVGFHWGNKVSEKSPPPDTKTNESGEPTNIIDDNDNAQNPFANLLTINIPTESTRQKKFIKTLAERRNKYSTNPKSKSLAQAIKREEEEARQRHERVEKSDPLHRLHPDEKDSDICTITSTTTTDGYASWRRPRDLRNAGNTQNILAHKVDTSFAWRVVLLLIVLWEIGSFVKTKLDDIYYWIFTSHLYRENIWLFEPTLFPNAEKYYMMHIQEWVHFFISGISLSIIHRENECVSVLFAFSLLGDGLIEVLTSTHDYVYLPDSIDMYCVILTSVHVVWKAVIICLFIGYHYYSAGYIRKEREFKHRKTKLHNHEIKAKGTKGLQKRRMAWTWMTRHARNTNLKTLKQKYPSVRNGNFPEDELAKEIKFNEAKELRLYAQIHNLNIGYPYNTLRDMKRYVFDRLEKSDYTENDDLEGNKGTQNNKIKGGTRPITLDKWKEWKVAKEEDERKRQRFSEAYWVDAQNKKAAQ